VVKHRPLLKTARTWSQTAERGHSVETVCSACSASTCVACARHDTSVGRMLLMLPLSLACYTARAIAAGSSAPRTSQPALLPPTPHVRA
jgi:hypothetical protein